MLERLNYEIRRRDTVVFIFPNEQSALRFTRSVPVYINEEWQFGARQQVKFAERTDKVYLLNESID